MICFKRSVLKLGLMSVTFTLLSSSVCLSTHENDGWDPDEGHYITGFGYLFVQWMYPEEEVIPADTHQNENALGGGGNPVQEVPEDG